MTIAIDVSSWGWPQWTYIVLFGWILLANLFLDGTPKSSSNYSAGAAFVSVALSAFILVSGGFFA